MKQSKLNKILKDLFDAARHGPFRASREHVAASRCGERELLLRELENVAKRIMDLYKEVEARYNNDCEVNEEYVNLAAALLAAAKNLASNPQITDMTGMEGVQKKLEDIHSEFECALNIKQGARPQ